MKVFVGWATEGERETASALCDWLPLVVPSVRLERQRHPVDSSSRWQSEAIAKLESAERAVICFSPASHFSTLPAFLVGLAGALCGTRRVWLYLHDMDPAELRGPLRRFNSVRANREGTKQLVRALCPVGGQASCRNAAKHWHVLEEELARISREHRADQPWEGLDAIDRDILISGI